MTSELARGEDSIFFVPDVLKQSAELHRLEAEAIAQNQSPQPVSEAYVVSRAQYRHRAKHDARVWENHRRWLQDQADSKLALRKSLRRADISKRLLPLGFVDADFDTLHLDGRWCSSCLYQNYDDDLAEWEYYEEELNLDTHDEEPQTRDQAMSTTTSDAQGAQVRVEGAVTRDPSLEQKLGDFREQAREEKMAAMLADLHTDCMPGPASLYQFFQSDERLTDEEWEKYKAPIVACKRQEALRPLFARLQPPKHSATSARASIPISFATFLALPTVETLWYPANAFIDARGWPPLEPQILSEIRTRIRLDKVILFDRLARAHVANTGVLLHTDTKAIASSSSTFVDCDPSKGLAPLHAALTDRDMDPLFAQVTSLFRCGICSTKLPYPDIAIHLVDDHYVPNVTAYAHVPSSDFRKAIKSLLDDLGHSSQLELAAFEVFYADCHFDVTTRSASGELETSVGETWAQVLSGKSPAELDAGLLKLSHSTDRNIVEIKLSTVSMSDEDA
uniref:Uncharacterized protein n=1 Tax=Rhodotorula toruloides TaxID=5286 RepID=A0A0K3CS02_RHOTO